jgi:hypothetical protein
MPRRLRSSHHLRPRWNPVGSPRGEHGGMAKSVCAAWGGPEGACSFQFRQRVWASAMKSPRWCCPMWIPACASWSSIPPTIMRTS